MNTATLKREISNEKLALREFIEYWNDDEIKQELLKMTPNELYEFFDEQMENGDVELGQAIGYIRGLQQALHLVVASR